MEVVTLEPFGEWSDEIGLLDQRSTRILSRRRRDLLGRTISVSMVISNNDSLNHLHDYRYDFVLREYDGQIDFNFYFYEILYRDRTTDSPTKTTYPITNSLINSLNGTANFSVESTWGYLDPKTGIHNGMTGHLVRGEVDIGGEFCSAARSRDRAVLNIECEQVQFCS